MQPTSGVDSFIYYLTLTALFERMLQPERRLDDGASFGVSRSIWVPEWKLRCLFYVGASKVVEREIYNKESVCIEKILHEERAASLIIELCRGEKSVFSYVIKLNSRVHICYSVYLLKERRNVMCKSCSLSGTEWFEGYDVYVFFDVHLSNGRSGFKSCKTRFFTRVEHFFPYTCV